MASSNDSQKLTQQDAETLKRLLKMHNLGIDRANDRVAPTKTTVDKKGFESVNFEHLPDNVKTLMLYWQGRCHEGPQSFTSRKQLFDDMDQVFYNNALMYRALEMMAEDVVQSSPGVPAINVDAQPKLKEFILQFWDDIKLDRFLKPTAIDIIKYGNAGWVLSSDDNGIEDINPISVPSDFVDRIEFTPFQVRKQLADQQSRIYKLNQFEKMRILIDSILNKDNYSAYFKSYLFGFQIGDYVLPPWRFLHFRNYTNEAPFHPFGIPYFVHSIAPYRQYDMALSLQVMARGARFPLYKYKLTLPNLFDPASKLEKGIEFLSELDNSGLYAVQKEGIGVGEKVVTIDGLFDVEEETPNIDLGKIDDIELLRDDLIISTGLPRNFLDPNNGSFGNSAISLKQQSIPYRRKVFHTQSILLEGITQMTKIHCIMSGKWMEKDIDFILSMPYPEESTDRELIGAQKDQLDLANDVLTSIAGKLIGDENAPLPPELVQQVYSTMLSYPKDRIETWIRAALVNRTIKAPENSEGAGEAGGEEGGGIFGGGEEEAPEEETKEENVKRKQTLKLFREAIARVGKTGLKESISNAFVERMQERYRNIAFNDRHYFSSKNKYIEFPAETLLRIKDEKIKMLIEGKESYSDDEVFTKNDYNYDVAYAINKEDAENLFDNDKPSGADTEGLQ